jgi:catechol 2,3-dioxygenase-like lactoylglutathione lyase family enzyme
MIIGAHTIIYSSNPDADRAFFRDVLNFPYIDSGEGWLIFALPPAEVGIHSTDVSGKHELYLLCEDIYAFIQDMVAHGVACSPVITQDWGWLTQVTLPGGGQLGVYQPNHLRPQSIK